MPIITAGLGRRDASARSLTRALGDLHIVRGPRWTFHVTTTPARSFGRAAVWKTKHEQNRNNSRAFRLEYRAGFNALRAASPADVAEKAAAAAAAAVLLS